MGYWIQVSKGGTMIIILITLNIIILLILIGYIVKYKTLKRDISITNKELEEFIKEENFKTLLITTEERNLRALLININKLINVNRQEASLRKENNETINKMLSNVSHDLKTPLTIILGYIEILNRDENLSIEERKEFLSKIYVKGKEVLDLINRFFNLAKLESGDKKIELEKINVTDIVKRSVLTFYDILSKEDISIDIAIPDKSIYALGNKEALERVMINLINNAYKYGREGKYLKIELSLKEEKVIIEVIDKGKGISKDKINKIFERSYIGDEARNKEASGSGLGLYISKKLLEAMKGEIEVISIPYTRTSFKVKLNKLTI